MCDAVEQLAKVQDTLAIMDKEISSGGSRPAATLSSLRTRQLALRTHIRGMVNAAAEYEQRSRRRIDSIEALAKV